MVLFPSMMRRRRASAQFDSNSPYINGHAPAMFDEQAPYITGGSPKAESTSANGNERAPGGLFGGGGRARGIIRREDGDPGTLLNYAVFGRNGVQDMRDASMRRDLFGRQIRSSKLEEAQQQQQQDAIAAMAAGLTPQQQAAALVNPDAAAAAQFRQPEQPDWSTDAQGRPYTIQPDGSVRFGQGQIAVPPRGGDGAGGITYHPMTPEEARVYGIPGNGSGFAVGSNGRPIRVGGGSFSPDQRARVEIGLDPAIEAVRTLDNLEQGLTDEQRARGVPGRPSRTSPRNQQWGASLVDMIDGEGTGAFARYAGGDEFQRYASAGSAFESGMLPILSGAAVTTSEASRMIRAALPQLGDGPGVLAEKARRRHQMLNGAAIIGGRPPPYPDEAVPEWATRAANAGGGDGGGGGDSPPEDSGITQEEWDAMPPEDRALWQ